MAILGNLLAGLGMSRRRSFGMWNRGYRRSRGHGMRGRMPGMLGGSMGRMAMGGLAVWLARGLINRRSMHH